MGPGSVTATGPHVRLRPRLRARRRSPASSFCEAREGLALELADALARQPDFLADRLERLGSPSSPKRSSRMPPLALGQPRRPPCARAGAGTTPLHPRRVGRRWSAKRSPSSPSPRRRPSGSARRSPAAASSASSTCWSGSSVASASSSRVGSRPSLAWSFPRARASFSRRSCTCMGTRIAVRLVRDRALARLADPPGGVGRELEPAPPVELLHRAVEADDAVLDQVEQGQVVALVALGDRDHEAEVRVDHPLLRRRVAALDALRQRDLVRRGEQRVAAGAVHEQGQRVGRCRWHGPASRRAPRRGPVRQSRRRASRARRAARRPPPRRGRARPRARRARSRRLPRSSASSRSAGKVLQAGCSVRFNSLRS